MGRWGSRDRTHARCEEHRARVRPSEQKIKDHLPRHARTTHDVQQSVGASECHQLLCWGYTGATAAANGIPNAVNTLPTAFTASYTNNRLTTFNGAAWTYDTQGNLTGDGTNTYVWDVRNRLTQIKQGATVTASFEYDALNRRTKKIIGTASTEYLHDGLTPVQEKRVGDVTQLITGPGIDDYLSRITTTIGATPTTTTRNYLTDFLGSTTALADDAGAIKTTYGYEPYGEATSTGEATVNSFQYTGRENDGTGLMYYRARYYHPKAKRFISEDIVGQGAGPNVYAYVEGSPMMYRDPEGKWIIGVVGAGVGAITGAAGSVAAQLVQNGGNWDCVDWGNVGWSAATGALGGLLLTTPLGLTWGGVMGTGAFTNTLNYTATNYGDYSGAGFLLAGVSGAAGGLVGGRTPNPYSNIRPSPGLNDISLAAQLAGAKSFSTNFAGATVSGYDYTKGAPSSSGCGTDKCKK
jgi:RHS repeat-associated protein